LNLEVRNTLSQSVREALQRRDFPWLELSEDAHEITNVAALDVFFALKEGTSSVTS
jgi:hypothetical protein